MVKDGTATTRFNLRRIWAGRTGEAILIIVSILLALLAEAAWNYRSDRADEAEILAGLREEFAGAQEEIDQDLEARALALRRIDALLAMRHDAPSTPPLDSVPGIVAALMDWRFYTPAHGVLDDVMASGRIELIRSSDIRRALMLYVRASDRLGVLDQMERDFVTARMEPFLAGHLSLERLIEPTDAFRRPEQEARRVLDLMADDTFASLVRLRRMRTDEASLFARLVQRRIGAVREALGEGD